MNGFFGFNPTAITFTAFCVCISLLLGYTYLPGLTIGLGIVLSLTLKP
jgi:hypothetical protein